MKNLPKLLFVYDHKYPSLWRDGLWAALNVLEKDFQVYRWNMEDEEPPNVSYYDFVLGWGGFNSKVDKYLQVEVRNKKGLCIAGNAYPPDGAGSYKVLFYETKWYRPQINFHENIVQAFGINSDIYFPSSMATPVVWDYVGVGSFALWKRWDKFLTKKGMRLVIGEYQKNNVEESNLIISNLISNNVMVSNMVAPEDLANIYRWSRTAYIPANIYGGGERAVWEARACGCTVEIEEDNPKLKELLLSEVKDHHWYAQQLKKGILSVI